MKRLFSAVLAFMMVFTLGFSADAVTPETDEEVEMTVIQPRSSLSMSFVNLGPKAQKTSIDTYYVKDRDASIVVKSITWQPASQDIRVGFYNIATGKNYTVTYSDGAVAERTIHPADDMPDGDYRIVVVNAGNRTITIK